MAVRICGDCGAPMSEHPVTQEKTKLQYHMAMMAVTVGNLEQRAAIQKTIDEWRAHVLPPCDPLATD